MARFLVIRVLTSLRLFSVDRAGIHGIQQDNKHVNWLSVGFFVYSALFSLSYLYYPNPLFHQVRSKKNVGVRRVCSEKLPG